MLKLRRPAHQTCVALKKCNNRNLLISAMIKRCSKCVRQVRAGGKPGESEGVRKGQTYGSKFPPRTIRAPRRRNRAQRTDPALLPQPPISFISEAQSYEVSRLYNLERRSICTNNSEPAQKERNKRKKKRDECRYNVHSLIHCIFGPWFYSFNPFPHAFSRSYFILSLVRSIVSWFVHPAMK